MKKTNLNEDLYKNNHEEYKKIKKKFLKWCLDNLPREDIINELKRKKIIKYNPNKETYEEVPERFIYQLKQGGIIVAEVDAPTEKEARKEIQHYLMMYSQDGEVEVIKK